MSNQESYIENIKNFKRGIRRITNFASAIATSIDERVIRYKDLSLGLNSGKLTHKERSRFTKERYRPYLIAKLLIEARGEEVTYDEFISALGDRLSSESKTKAREQIKSTIRDLRRGFNINRRKNPDDDIFIDTGDGYKLK